MPIFYLDSGSIDRLEVSSSLFVSGSALFSGSTNIIGSGSGIFRITGSTGGLFAVSEKTAANPTLFAVTYLGDTLFQINDSKRTSISGSLVVTGSITGSLLGTASFATTASFASTASFALNAGGGAGFPYSGSAVITGSLTVSGSEVKELNVIGDSYFTGSLFIASNIVASQITGSVQAVDSISARSVGGSSVLGLQNAINALSSRISAIVGPASAQPTRYVSVANVLNTATLTGFSGMTVSVSAGVIYKFEGQIVYSISAATGNAFGLVWPTANRVAGQWLGGISVNGTGASTFSLLAVGDFDTGDSNSAVWSAAVGLGLHLAKVDGVIDAQVGGAFYPVGRSSVATNTLTIARGSFFKLTRIN